MTPEGRVKAAVKLVLHAYGRECYQFWPVQMGMGAATLDCLFTIRGYSFAIETKAPGNDLTPRQKITRNEMADANITVFVVDSVEGAKGLAMVLARIVGSPPEPVPANGFPHGGH